MDARIQEPEGRWESEGAGQLPGLDHGQRPADGAAAELRAALERSANADACADQEDPGERSARRVAVAE